MAVLDSRQSPPPGSPAFLCYWKAPHFSGKWKTLLQKMVEKWNKKKVKRTFGREDDPFSLRRDRMDD